ncbi:hypothetical protein Save01_01388 [Streptomyces avermitilis]|uniref:Uncharacterized protein n=2 Tax=Streptomyces avermitilis TaxID=33903 RepID=Q82BL2_STRAW|nr:hypothetical protein SAVERM_5692 [Streptomyces avermitilis MA-4680 = NBRC 14893]BBJ53876.1 hypothetical protein SAVMC3_65050 [Streptomyces avermitilis]GDY65875.1 hypothetical protein SAV14893_052680 [Streptomyces avermitilis]GDY73901.1 hypothetical protein SAV31267_033860 [Streptomyces avermitilis]GDY82980.1 hypothetical protein SAVCW2_21790 [Streptomyces avermitilis]
MPVRIAYRGTGVADLHPADAVLNLPDAMHSHGLARLAAIESARGSYADACERINAVTGSGRSRNSLSVPRRTSTRSTTPWCPLPAPTPRH